MTIQPPSLRPLKIGEILDRAFRLYRAHFILFIGIAGILLIPFLALELLSLFFFQDVRVVNFIEGIATTNVLPGALVWAASRVYLGQPVSLNKAYQLAWGRFWAFFGANFLQGLAYIPIGIVAFIIGSMGNDRTIVTLIVVLLIAPYVFFFHVRWSLNVPIIILEGLGASRSLGRSWALTSKDTNHVFGAVLAAVLLVYLVASLPGLAVDYARTLLASMSEIGEVLSLVIKQLGALISTPFSTIALVILYYDLRVRREGYDLELALETSAEEQDIIHEAG